jgi:hypothetical protein
MTEQEFDPYQQWLGIDSSERPINYYRLLGLSRYEADPQRIAAAAEERMRYVRTFQTGPRGLYTQQLLNEMAAAKLRLLNPTTKHEYDERLRESERAAAEFALEDELDLPEPTGPLATPDFAPPASTYPSSPPSAPATQTAAAPATADDARIHVQSRTHRPAPQTAAPQPLMKWLSLVLAMLLAAGGIWYAVSQFVGGNSPADSTPHSGQDDPAEPDPPVEEGVVQQLASGEVRFPASAATIQGTTAQFVQEGPDGVVTDWTSSADSLLWRFRVRRGAVFDIHVTYAVDRQPAQGRIEVSFDQQKRSWDLRSGGDLSRFVTDQDKIVQIQEPGLHTLNLRILETPQGQVFALKSVELKPRVRK